MRGPHCAKRSRRPRVQTAMPGPNLERRRSFCQRLTRTRCPVQLHCHGGERGSKAPFSGHDRKPSADGYSGTSKDLMLTMIRAAIPHCKEEAATLTYS